MSATQTTLVIPWVLEGSKRKNQSQKSYLSGLLMHCLLTGYSKYPYSVKCHAQIPRHIRSAKRIYTQLRKHKEVLWRQRTIQLSTES